MPEGRTSQDLLPSTKPGDTMRYWINTVSRDHVLAGIEGGFTQADHGKNTRLNRLERGDLIAFYSPRTQFRGGEPLQAFTAIGRIVDEDPYQVEMNPDFHPWRRRVEFLESEEAPIRPLIQGLSFIENKQQWGFPFRRGLFEVEPSDFERIAEAMGVDLETPAPPVLPPTVAMVRGDVRRSTHLPRSTES